MASGPTCQRESQPFIGEHQTFLKKNKVLLFTKYVMASSVKPSMASNSEDNPTAQVHEPVIESRN